MKIFRAKNLNYFFSNYISSECVKCLQRFDGIKELKKHKKLNNCEIPIPVTEPEIATPLTPLNQSSPDISIDEIISNFSESEETPSTYEKIKTVLENLASSDESTTEISVLPKESRPKITRKPPRAKAEEAVVAQIQPLQPPVQTTELKCHLNGLYCDEIFATLDDFEKHQKLWHSNYISNDCPKCIKKFLTPEDLWEHINDDCTGKFPEKFLQDHSGPKRPRRSMNRLGESDQHHPDAKKARAPVLQKPVISPAFQFSKKTSVNGNAIPGTSANKENHTKVFKVENGSPRINPEIIEILDDEDPIQKTLFNHTKNRPSVIMQMNSLFKSTGLNNTRSEVSLRCSGERGNVCCCRFCTLCTKCKQRFSSRGHMLAHKEISCKDNGNKGRNHRKNGVSIENIKCNVCGESFNKNDFLQHFKTHEIGEESQDFSYKVSTILRPV